VRKAITTAEANINFAAAFFRFGGLLEANAVGDEDCCELDGDLEA